MNASVEVELPPKLRRLAHAAATSPPRAFGPRLADGQGGKQSAVLILLADGGSGNAPADGGSGSAPAADGGSATAPAADGAGVDLLLLERAATLRRHAGQPAFPGGGAEAGDADLVATALREATEEVGLHPETALPFGTLPQLGVPVSGYVVTPVLAWWRDPHPVSVQDPAEVSRVARVPIIELSDPANRLTAVHPSGHRGPAFDVCGMRVWGFTAFVISRLLELAGWGRPWDSDRTGRVSS